MRKCVLVQLNLKQLIKFPLFFSDFLPLLHDNTSSHGQPDSDLIKNPNIIFDECRAP